MKNNWIKEKCRINNKKRQVRLEKKWNKRLGIKIIGEVTE